MYKHLGSVQWHAGLSVLQTNWLVYSSCRGAFLESRTENSSGHVSESSRTIQQPSHALRRFCLLVRETAAWDPFEQKCLSQHLSSLIHPIISPALCLYSVAGVSHTHTSPWHSHLGAISFQSAWTSKYLIKRKHSPHRKVFTPNGFWTEELLAAKWLSTDSPWWPKIRLRVKNTKTASFIVSQINSELNTSFIIHPLCTYKRVHLEMLQQDSTLLLLQICWSHFSSQKAVTVKKKKEKKKSLARIPISIATLASLHSLWSPEDKSNITSNISANMICGNQASECCLVYFWGFVSK